MCTTDLDSAPPCMRHLDYLLLNLTSAAVGFQSLDAGNVTEMCAWGESLYVAGPRSRSRCAFCSGRGVRCGHYEPVLGIGKQDEKTGRRHGEQVSASGRSLVVGGYHWCRCRCLLEYYALS